ncbi:hypothetical protein QJQ45_007237 [Haematococcus lacustris]|nr:hypothetical protein QJQ45_007237 [Haematococcus lacustris]
MLALSRLHWQQLHWQQLHWQQLYTPWLAGWPDLAWMAPAQQPFAPAASSRTQALTLALQNSSTTYSCCALLLTADPDDAIVIDIDKAHHHAACMVLDEEQRSLPSYAPGFLGFREVPVYQQLLARCAEVAGGCFMPQVVLVDGCGRLHPERCGSASHLGVLTGLPTVGCAKSLLAVEGLSRRAIEAALAPRAAGPVAAQSGIATRASRNLTLQPEVHNTHGQSPLARSFDTDAHQGRAMEEAAEACNSPTSSHAPVSGQLPTCGCSFPVCNVAGRSTGVMLHAANGELLGAAITSPSSKKPLYVSVGHRLSLETSLALVARCSLARIPEPLRQADLRSRDFIRTHML